MHLYKDVTIAGEELQIKDINELGVVRRCCCDRCLGIYGLINHTVTLNRRMEQARRYGAYNPAFP